MKKIAPTWNDGFGFPESSYSVLDIQDYIDYIIKRYKELPTNSPIHIDINRINNKLVFKIEDVQNLELETPEKMKLFAIGKKIYIYMYIYIYLYINIYQK